MLFLDLLVAGFCLVMLARHGPRALLAIAPGAIRVTGDPGGAPRTTGQVETGERLEGLGFRRLGTRRDRGPLGGLDVEVDAWVHADGTCADAFPGGARGVAVTFVTEFADGFQLATSNFRRLGADGPRGRLGGLPGATLEAAFAAHRKAAEPLAAAHGAPPAVADLEARVDVARRGYAGIGARELRRPVLLSLVNAILAVALLATAVRNLVRAAGWIP